MERNPRWIRRGIKAALCAVLVYFLGFNGSLVAYSADETDTVIAKFRYVYEEDARMDYPVRLLRAALAVSKEEFGPYIVQTVDEGFSRRREILEVVTGDRLNILWAPPLDVLVEETTQIPIPILKGLGGYRVFLIRGRDQEKFSAVENLAQLKILLAGQGAGWRDVDIFRHNGMRVVTSPKFSLLFKMLAHGRFDYFPRGVNEVVSDFDSFRHEYKNLAIEKKLLLAYQKPVFFFVSKTSPNLAKRIEVGLKKMKETGEFEVLWRRFHGTVLKRLDIENRKIIRIDNPFSDIDLSSAVLPTTMPPNH